MTDQKQQTPPSSKLGLTAEEAAGASIAQSIALAAQNEVDAYRNQNTVNMVAMGVAYAKWLQNPMLGQQYSEVVKSARLNLDQAESQAVKAYASRADAAPPPPPGGAAPMSSRSSSAATGTNPPSGSNPLAGKVFSYFLSPPAKPDGS
ncbi:hypothetical protein [Rheinheimera sp. F8]|uniref:hypothetical protein n=1 Tax=Rheinheimera sp. F8 TaxID=1763998 RepID=UPI0007449F21|nr:hypothetical protein [Rheinheimera sp. F8]ALZ74588.1 hypothetical protein ATY27_01645 [Rheinheimera sp. F8]